MKLVLRVFAITSIAFFMVYCGDGGSTGATNKYIDEAPGVSQSYTVKISELEQEQEESTDFGTVAELEKEIEQAEEEAKTRIKEIEATLTFPIEIPFEESFENEKYTINKLKITGIRYNDLLFEAEIIPKVTRSNMFGYVLARDADGNPLLSNEDWTVMMVYNWRDTKEGEPAVMKGYFKGLEKLEDLEKFTFHPRSEYEKYK